MIANLLTDLMNAKASGDAKKEKQIYKALDAVDMDKYTVDCLLELMEEEED